MKPIRLTAGLFALLFLSSCQSANLASIQSVENGSYRGVNWEGRTYWPYAVVSRRDATTLIGFVDEDREERISQYLDYPEEEWLVSWLVYDGGAMLLKEENTESVISGIEREYPPVD